MQKKATNSTVAMAGCHDNTKIAESLPHLNITGCHANAKIVQLLAQLSFRLA